jgi:hypothetical protein
VSNECISIDDKLEVFYMITNKLRISIYTSMNTFY